MDERILQLRVGVVVLSSMVIMAILVLMFGEAWTSKYTVVMNFKTAPGVSVNTPVRKNGILIGRVSKVETTDSGVRLIARINSGENLYANEICRISSASFLGDAIIEFVPGDSEQRGDLLKDNSLIVGIVQPGAFDALDALLDMQGNVTDAIDSVKSAGDSISSAGNEVTILTQRVNDAFDGTENDISVMLQNMKRLSAKTEVALDNFNLAMGHINEVVGDPQVKNDIKTTLAGLPEFLAESKLALAEAQKTFTQFQSVGEKAETNLENLKGLSEPLGERGGQMVAQLESSLGGLNQLVTQINTFAESLNRGEGTLGLLVKDRELYNELISTVRNAELISRQLKPIITNFNVLSDKMARDPSVLIKGSDGLKGNLIGRRPWEGAPR